jgi:hypothetical protein
MTAGQYLLAMARLGLSRQTEAAAFLGIDVRSARRYGEGRSPVPHATALLLQLMIDRKITPGDLGFTREKNDV